MGFDQFLQADARRPGLPGKMGVRRIYYDLHKAQHRTLLRKQPDRDRHFHGLQRICGFACSVCIRPDRVQRKKSCDADVRINAVHPVDLHQLPNLPAALRPRTQGYADRCDLCLCQSRHRGHVLHPSQLFSLHSKGNGGGGDDGRLRLYRHVFQDHRADCEAGPCHSRDHGVFE